MVRPAGVFGAAATLFSASWAAWALDYPLVWPPLALAIGLTYHLCRLHVGGLDAQRRVQMTSDLHLATIEALAGAIDAKDQTTHSHIRRVQIYATGLAEALGLPTSDVQAVKTAAMLHDIGKLAVPDYILSKPGPLTPEELQKMRIHSSVGAEIIAGVPFPYPVAPLILGHHERWDGKGYPQGLSGEAIPTGARILAIVDYYDAVTSERPYHNALTHHRAVELLREESGMAFEPALVDRFIRLLPSLISACEAAAAIEAGETHRAHAPGAAGTGTQDRATAFEHIGLAHREIYALYQIAQAMGTSRGVADTMALISSKLATVIPWSGCVLFIQQQETGLLRCLYAAGVDAPRLLDTTIRIGEGLSGRVARHRRTLVDLSPRLEFEAAGVTAALSVQSAIVCPLYVGDVFIGSLGLFHTDPHCYVDDHRRLITSVAEQAGAVIHNSIAFEQAQEDSLTDPLTSLPNRRSMFARLTHELARAERLQSQLALIVLDVDDFKRINDTRGHHVGDQTLLEVACALKLALRPYDLCVRFAGDEFVIVISDCPPEDAELKRVELQQRIGAIEIDGGQGGPFRLRASAGAAVFPDDGTTTEALLAEADRRMYRDKSVRRAVAPQRADADWSIPGTGRLAAGRLNEVATKI